MLSGRMAISQSDRYIVCGRLARLAWQKHTRNCDIGTARITHHRNSSDAEGLCFSRIGGQLLELVNGGVHLRPLCGKPLDQVAAEAGSKPVGAVGGVP